MLRMTLAAAALGAGAAMAQPAPEGMRATVNGMQIYYEVSGQGDPMIVLHGSFMTIPGMGDIVERLARTHRVYALELQGHGRSTDTDRAMTYHNLAGDVATFMEVAGIPRADVFGYSMGAVVGLRLAIDHPDKVDQLIAASTAYDLSGMQPEYNAMVPSMAPEMFIGTPMEDAWKQYAPNPDGFRPFVERMIALEHEPMAWEADVKALKAPVLLIAGDADVMTLEHTVAMFRLLGGGAMGDMGQPLPASRLAVLPATSHTAVIGQAELLHQIIEPFLNGTAPKGMFD